ncbi:hypothetical protein AK812_SmicGene7123 [Symbiodinium microadriaticum]|uniref:Uncharacterized protein n=1 Tax=Symbiodinium microadriaticum TaxID=2951 RepID=A0A1Q9EP95_SYMMI|nr:hypothetical protein AK812_SmicGene7123 [Symbiodinium microadriaticum]
MWQLARRWQALAKRPLRHSRSSSTTRLSSHRSEPGEMPGSERTASAARSSGSRRLKSTKESSQQVPAAPPPSSQASGRAPPADPDALERPTSGASEAASRASRGSRASRRSQAASSAGLSSIGELPRHRSWQVPTKSVLGPKDEASGYSDASRKLEQRLQKARSELLQRGRAWDSWVLNMRTAYAKEQERHASVQRRLNSEIAEMEASVKEAYMKVQFAALHQSGSASSSQVPQPLEWESAMDIDSNLSHEQMQAEMHRMIHQAATMDGSSTPTRGTGVPPRTPVRVAPGDPSGSLASDVPIDPYPTPPGFGATPGAQASLDIRTPAPPGLETTSAHGPTLAEKLSDKRRSHRSALAPFGIRPRGSSNEAEDANQVFPGVGTTLLDDDNEELSAVSPGLGRMDG